MKLTSDRELSDFLTDFSRVIEQLDTGKTLRTFTQNDNKLFVDPKASGELRFLVQFYNEMAVTALSEIDLDARSEKILLDLGLSVNADLLGKTVIDQRKFYEIDLDALWEKKLLEAGLSGVNTDMIDPNLLAFFSKFGLVNHNAHLEQPQQLRHDIAELKMLQQKMAANHFYKKPLADFIKFAECEDNPKDGTPFKNLPVFSTFNNLNKMVTATRKLVAPKLGDKNCFSYDARLADYKTQARLNGLASFGNGLLGAASMILSAAMCAAALLVAAIIIKVSAGSLLLVLAIPGSILAEAVASIPGVGVFAIGLGLFEKADYQRRMRSTMFSVADAKTASARTAKEALLLTPALI